MFVQTQYLQKVDSAIYDFLCTYTGAAMRHKLAPINTFLLSALAYFLFKTLTPEFVFIFTRHSSTELQI